MESDIGWKIFHFVPFPFVKNVENSTCKVLYVPFFTFFTMENGTDRKFSSLCHSPFQDASNDILFSAVRESGCEI